MKTSKLGNVAYASLAKSLAKRNEQGVPNAEAFNFDSLVKKFREVIESFPDKRTGRNISKKLLDAALGAFSVFYTQCPSFLSYQKSMQVGNGKNNAASLFGIEEILSDSHIRRLLDVVPPSDVFPMFHWILDGLDANGYLSDFRSYEDNLLVALDGTQYFSSATIHCDKCSQTTHKNGSRTYSHSAITPVVVKSGIHKVISLTPEFITPQDGHEKQDCENAAAKRWIGANGKRLNQLGVTILGDDLYCKQPICDLLLAQGLDFILTCKEESHSTLYEYVTFLQEESQTLEVVRWKGKKQFKDTYRFLNEVPLRNGKDALEVNWCELTTTRVDDGRGQIKYHNTFATNFTITKENVIQIVTDGRTRWKVENENNNVLKNNGYNLEHNFGHGKEHLSSLLMTFNLLAFLVHTLQDLFEQGYQLIRKTLPTREMFFQDIRTLTRYKYFGDWHELMSFMLEGLKLMGTLIEEFPDTS